MTYLPQGLPAPVAEPDDLSTPFWTGLTNRQILIQRCCKCRGWQWGPEWICHRCHSFDLEWSEVEGRGRIFSWTRVWHPVHPALSKACPYRVVVVELQEAQNVRLVGNLLGDSGEDVVIGQAVTAVFEMHAGPPAFTLLQWMSAD